MAETVKEVVSAPSQPSPKITRQMVEVPELDAQGNPTGEMVQQERIIGNSPYSVHLIPPGRTMNVTVDVDGAVLERWSWNATARPGRNAIGQVRFKARDDCLQTTLEEAAS